MNVFLKGKLTALDFFIDQMSMGIKDSVVLDLSDEQDFFNQIKRLDSHLDSSTYVITFNNVGAAFEVNGVNYWENKGVKFYNILVDHPAYYFKDLQNMPFMKIICIDLYHKEYIEKHFSDRSVHFLPHGGAKNQDAFIRDWEKRDIDVLYVGGKYQDIFANHENSTINYPFLEEIYHLLCQYPQFTLEQIVEICEEEMGTRISENRLAIMNDLYAVTGNSIRAYYQEKVIETLAGHGITIDIYGHGWEEIKAKYPDHIRLHGHCSPQHCIEEMGRSKIALNILPWFKHGAHERVYNAMFAGAVCVSDTSEYLSNYFNHGEDIILFDLKQLDSLVNQIRELLAKPDRSKHIVQNQFLKIQNSSWSDRFENIRSGNFRAGIDFV